MERNFVSVEFQIQVFIRYDTEGKEYWRKSEQSKQYANLSSANGAGFFGGF